MLPIPYPNVVAWANLCGISKFFEGIFSYLHEVSEAIPKLKGGKTAGMSDIPAELLKARG